MNSDIRHFIIKYLNQSASESELDALNQWLKKPTNKEQFQEFARINYALDHIMEDFDTEQKKNELLSGIRKMKHQAKVRKLWIRTCGVAASILLIVSLSLFVDRKTETPIATDPIVNNNQIAPVKNRAVLLLENGEEIALEEGKTLQTSGITNTSEGLVYSTKEVKDKKRDYNVLTVPRGGQFFIKLSDRTKVWLNSGSKLRYPVHFSKGESRQVELVYGEAFFEVSPSNEHNGADFKVFHQQQEIQVLGTEFNVKAYPDEAYAYTTLVEGKVQINTPGDHLLLSPKDQSAYNLKTGGLTVKEVDVNEETSWIHGEYIFRHESLKKIMTVLSRWYDMEVIFRNNDLEEVKFVGRIQKDQEITEILDRIKDFDIIHNYEINEKQIILK